MPTEAPSDAGSIPAVSTTQPHLPAGGVLLCLILVAGQFTVSETRAHHDFRVAWLVSFDFTPGNFIIRH
jgi:hypothetical protein